MNLSESSESPDFNSPNLISDDGRTSETEFPLVNANLDGMYLDIEYSYNYRL